MAQTQIPLTEEQAAALEKLAKQRNVSLTELVQQGIEDLLRSQGASSRADLKRRALALTGRFRSGLADLSTRHDDYLDQSEDS